jgi:dethiobiotin synthetase
MAAAREGRQVDVAAVVGFCRAQMAQAGDGRLLIEGVGGVMSPIAAEVTNLDWMRALDCPVLLVGGSYLGSISHALTAIAALRGAGLALAGVVISQSAANDAPFEETVASVARLSAAPVVAAARDARDATWTEAVLDVIGRTQ